jgi:hypothetical protein
VEADDCVAVVVVLVLPPWTVVPYVTVTCHTEDRLRVHEVGSDFGSGLTGSAGAGSKGLGRLGRPGSGIRGRGILGSRLIPKGPISRPNSSSLGGGGPGGGGSGGSGIGLGGTAGITTGGIGNGYPAISAVVDDVEAEDDELGDEVIAGFVVFITAHSGVTVRLVCLDTGTTFGGYVMLTTKDGAGYETSGISIVAPTPAVRLI